MERTICGKGYNPPIRELLIRKRGKGNALNEGIRHSVGDLIAVIDADCVLQEGALRLSSEHFEKEEVVAVGGRLCVMEEDNSLFWEVSSGITCWGLGYLIVQFAVSALAAFWESKKRIGDLLNRLPYLAVMTVIGVFYQLIVVIARFYGMITFPIRRLVW